ncbi:MAG: hypothetical protein LC803_10000 [Acidobacteria bacterium]|nr:hypothetical protein [Acidobacteriota bacterium]
MRHGGTGIGGEISGNVRNVFVENCRMDSPNLDRVLRFKSNALGGGVLENVFLRNVQIGRVAEAVLTIDFLEVGLSEAREFVNPRAQRLREQFDVFGAVVGGAEGVL